jgi:hypothetical protein
VCCFRKWLARLPDSTLCTSSIIRR